MSGFVKLLGAGSLLLDYLVRVPDDFLRACVPGGKGGRFLVSAAEIRRLVREAGEAHVVRAPGGSAANTVRAFAGLGLPASFLCKTGNDPEGAFLREGFERDGGGSGSFKRDPVLPTGCCLCLITPDSERTMCAAPGASENLTEADICESDFDGVTHVYAEGYLLSNFPFLRRLLRQAKKHGCTASLDLSSAETVRAFRAPLLELLQEGLADVLFANEREAEAFSSVPDVMKSLDCMEQFAPVCIVKTGADGARIRMKGRTFHTPAEPVPVTDTTGAGDLWQAGFLYGFLRGMPPEFCGAAGAAMAGEVIRHTGAVIPVSRRTALRDRLLEMERSFAGGKVL